MVLFELPIGLSIIFWTLIVSAIIGIVLFAGRAVLYCQNKCREEDKKSMREMLDAQYKAMEKECEKSVDAFLKREKEREESMKENGGKYERKNLYELHNQYLLGTSWGRRLLLDTSWDRGF